MGVDPYKRHKTEHPGITYRAHADGSRAYHVYWKGNFRKAGHSIDQALRAQQRFRRLAKSRAPVRAKDTRVRAYTRDRISSGYVRVAIGSPHPMADLSGRALEHRVVMAAVIGRPLLPEEVVHHVDGDRTNNRVENLWLFPNISSHRQWHSAGTEPTRAMPAVLLTKALTKADL